MITGFLYSHFVVGADLAPLTSQKPSVPLVLLQEFQQFLVCAALIVAALAARGTTWGPTYRRLATGLIVSFAILTISDWGILQGLYSSGGVYDVMWILPFAFFAWAAASAPASSEADYASTGPAVRPSPPWVVFGVLGALRLLISASGGRVPIASSLEGFATCRWSSRYFPCSVAHRAAGRRKYRRPAGRPSTPAAAATTEQADDLISISDASRSDRCANSAFCRALGWDPKEVSLRPATEFLADESRPQLDAIRTAAPTAQRGAARWCAGARTSPYSCHRGSVIALTDVPGRWRARCR